jgi:hypothetical protein
MVVFRVLLDANIISIREMPPFLGYLKGLKDRMRVRQITSVAFNSEQQNLGSFIDNS